MKRRGGATVDFSDAASQVCVCYAPGPIVGDFLKGQGLAGRVEVTDRATSMTLTDDRFRPVQIMLPVAREMAATISSDVILLRDLDLPGAADADNFVVHPNGSFWALGRADHAAAVSLVPNRATPAERWLIVAPLPGTACPQDLIESLLPAGRSAPTSLCDADGWFLAEFAGGLPGMQRELSERIAALGGNSPRLLVRVNGPETTIWQPGVRQCEQFPIAWGVRRSLVHPRSGIVATDQDQQVVQFAAAWRRCGGLIDEMCLQDLGRRPGLRPAVLRPVLRCLGVPSQLASIACSLAATDQPVVTA